MSVGIRELHFKVEDFIVLVHFFNGTAKTKLEILAFLNWGEFVKNPTSEYSPLCHRLLWVW